MKTRNIASCLGVLSACLAISSSVIAEDNCSGYVIGVGNARVNITDDRTLPEHLATGNCHTIAEGHGKCTFMDKDGDEWTNEWTGSRYKGTYRTVTGTGKHAKAIDSHGWWKLLRTMYSPSGEPVDIAAFGGYCALVAQRK